QGFLNQCTTDASVRAGDQDCFVFDVHNVLLPNHCPFYWLLRIARRGGYVAGERFWDWRCDLDTLAVGVDRIQRNFEPMQRQVEHWRQAQITDERAKLILYAAFVDGKLDAPRSLLPEVHRLYFEAAVRGVLGTHDVEFIQRLHQR